jgi:hypothetical protein
MLSISWKARETGGYSVLRNKKPQNERKKPMMQSQYKTKDLKFPRKTLVQALIQRLKNLKSSA